MMVDSIRDDTKHAVFFRAAASVLTRLFLLFFFKACLDIATVLVSSQALGIYSIELQFSAFTIVAGYTACLVLALCLPPWQGRLDALFIWVLTLFIGVPLIIPFQWGGAEIEWLLVSVAFLALLGLQSRVRLLAVTPWQITAGRWFLVVFLGGVAAYALASSILTVGLTPTFDFSMVYEIRDRFAEQKIPYAAYVYKWTAFIVVPFLFVLGRIRKIPLLILASLAIALVLFFASGHKMFLLIPGLVFIFDWCIQRRDPMPWIVLGLSAIVLTGTVSFYTIGDVRLNATFSNRLYILPAKISYEYHEFFSQNPKIRLSHSVLENVYDYPYSVPPTSLIAGRYYGDPEGSPNTGILADAFMNFGYAGVVALWVCVSGFLRLLRWLGERRNPRLLLSLVLVPIFTWINAGFLTSFLNGGLLLGLIGAISLPLVVQGRRFVLTVDEAQFASAVGRTHAVT